MSRTLGKITRRGLLRAPGRFIALFLIVMLGAAFLAGLQSTAPDMAGTADDYFTENRLADFRLTCDLGITQDDVDAVAAADGVAQAGGTFRVDLTGSIGDTPGIYAIHSLPADAANGNYLSQLTLTAGRLPKTPGECVADSSEELTTASHSSIQLGDKVILAEDNPADSLDMLSSRELTVVGLARSSAYISTARGNSGVGSGRITDFLYVPQTAFTSEYYTGIELRLSSTEGLSAFSDEYAAAIEEGRALLEDLTQRRAKLRHDDITAEAEASLSEAEAEYESESTQVEADLAQAKEALEDGRMNWDEGIERYEEYSASLARSRRELDQGWTELAASQRELGTQRAALETSRNTLTEGRATLRELERQDDDLRAALALETDATAAATLRAQIDALRTQIDALAAQVGAGEAELSKAEQQLSAAEAAYTAAEGKLTAGEQEYRAGESALWELYYGIEQATERIGTGQQEYDRQSAEASETLSEARAELDRNRSELEALALPAWSITQRDDFPGYADFANDKDRIANLSVVLPWFFFIVAAIVCLTTMTRLVEEQRGQIGTLKACGYRRGQIGRIYQTYAWLIGLGGGVVGVAIGLLTFPPAIWSSYALIYHMGPLKSVLTPLPCLTGLLGGAVALALATAFACHRTLNRDAAELMRPRAPRAGKRVFLEGLPRLWRRIPFSRKVTIRNLLRYRTRFAVTVIGVAGCTALLLAAFGLRDSLSGVVESQYGEGGVSHARATLVLSTPSGANEDTELNRTLADVTHTYVHAESVTVSFGDRTSGNVVAYLAVPEDPAALGDFVTLRQRQGHEPLAFPNATSAGGVTTANTAGSTAASTAASTAPAVVITEQLATILGVEVGDRIGFGAPSGVPASAYVSGIAENYVYNYLYLAPATYERLFGASPEYRSVYLASDVPEEEFEALLAELVAKDNVATALPSSQLREVVDVVIANMNTVVSLMIGAALILAGVVLYNLISIMVMEREREFATMKVLGYRRAQIAAFLSRETTVMTVIGLLIGLPLGVWLHGYVMATIEVNELMFPHTILPLSFVLAVVFPLLCNYVVNLCVRPRLNRLDPAKVLKSIE